MERNARAFAECDRRVRLLCVSETIAFYHISIKKLSKTSPNSLGDSCACFGANKNVCWAGDTHINSWFLCATASPLSMSTTDMKIIGSEGLHLSFGEQMQQIAEEEEIEGVASCCRSASRDVPPVLRKSRPQQRPFQSERGKG